MIFLKTSQIDEVVNLLNEGKIVAFPTETVYGLGVLATKKEYFDELVRVKKRDPNKPFTLMISSLKQVEDILYVSDFARKIIDKFSPGPLTIILKAKENIPSYLDLNTGFVGIRIPNSEFILKVIDKINKPLLVPSANPANLTPAKNDSEVYSYFKDEISAIVKGKSLSNIPSTVIKIDKENVIMLREGNIKLDEILEATR